MAGKGSGAKQANSQHTLPARPPHKQQQLSRRYPPEKAKAPHSSTLAWKVPWTEELGGLQSMGSLGVRHD